MIFKKYISMVLLLLKPIFLALFLSVLPISMTYMEDFYPLAKSKYEMLFDDEETFFFFSSETWSDWLYSNRIYFILFFSSIIFLFGSYYLCPFKLTDISFMEISLSEDIDELFYSLESLIPRLDYLKLWAILYELDQIVGYKHFVLKYLRTMLVYYSEHEQLCEDPVLVKRILVKLIIEINDQYYQFPIPIEPEIV